MIQGVGGALLFTNSAAIVTDAFRRGRVGLGLGINTIAFSAGFLIGPVMGGILTAIDWRWVFLDQCAFGNRRHHLGNSEAARAGGIALAAEL